jgi:hypothetical protein
MTQEEKQLLLADLCARLPYGVKCQFEDTVRVTDGESDPFYDYVLSARDLELFINHKNFYIKPYLRPVSSMNGEEKNEFRRVSNCKVYKDDFYNEYDEYSENFTYIDKDTEIDTFDWLNAHHFDYRGLISMGLAIEVTSENNPYKE